MDMEHKARHIELHKALDELVADWIRHTKLLPCNATVMDVLKWSHEQTENPTELNK